jgi:hypothetical protein
MKLARPKDEGSFVDEAWLNLSDERKKKLMMKYRKKKSQ